MTRVFVVGAHVPAGGTYMAYHVGRILARRSGRTTVAVQVGNETAASSRFTYPDELPSVRLDELLAVATADDVLVCNPSFSDHLLGLRFPGQRVMYVQGVSTYRVIDGFFDHYVAVSTFVQRHLALHYGWDVPVIPPFVELDHIGPPRPWGQRPAASILAFPKAFGSELLERIRSGIAARLPGGPPEITVMERMSHDDVLRAMQVHRFFLAVSPLEGHPLAPIEAMRSGCCVVGFHGGGGLDFLRPGQNCAAVGYPRVDVVIDDLVALLGDHRRSAALAGRGYADAARFSYDAFERRWTDFAERHLCAQPSP